MDPNVPINEEVVRSGRLPLVREINPVDNRENLLRRNSIVRQPIHRMDSDILPGSKKRKNQAGRKKKFTPTKMKNSINAYFDWCEKEDRVPSIKGLMIHLNMYRDQFYQYLSYPEFKDIMEHARLIISEWCENDVYRTKGQAAAKIAYMKNVHDWTEKVDSNTTVTKVLSVEESRAKIEMLAPKLLEVLKNSTVLSQIIQREDTSEAVEAIIEKEPIPSLGLVENPRRLHA